MSGKRFGLVVIALALSITATLLLQSSLSASPLVVPAGNSIGSALPAADQAGVPAGAPVSTSWRYGIPSNFIQPIVPYDVYEEIEWEFSHLAPAASVREAIPSNFIQPVMPTDLVEE